LGKLKYRTQIQAMSKEEKLILEEEKTLPGEEYEQ
jgi:hypothetical protein